MIIISNSGDLQTAPDQSQTCLFEAVMTLCRKSLWCGSLGSILGAVGPLAVGLESSPCGEAHSCKPQQNHPFSSAFMNQEHCC